MMVVQMGQWKKETKKVKGDRVRPDDSVQSEKRQMERPGFLHTAAETWHLFLCHMSSVTHVNFFLVNVMQRAA